MYQVSRGWIPCQRWTTLLGTGSLVAKISLLMLSKDLSHLFVPWEQFACWGHLVQSWAQYITLKLYFYSKNTYENCLIISHGSPVLKERDKYHYRNFEDEDTEFKEPTTMKTIEKSSTPKRSKPVV